jgi:hypothetical protein
MRDYLVPPAERVEPGVATAIKEFGPDVVLADQQAYTRALAADRLGVPSATSASTTTD